MNKHRRRTLLHGQTAPAVWILLLTVCLIIPCLLAACGGEAPPAEDTVTSLVTPGGEIEIPIASESSASDLPTSAPSGNVTKPEATADAEDVTDGREPPVTDTDRAGDPTGADTPDHTASVEPPTSQSEPTTSAPEEGTVGEVLTLAPPVETQPFDPAQVARETMPRLDINTDNGQMIQGNHLDKPVYHSSVSLTLCDEAYVLTNVGAEVHVRGNSTAGAAKKPLALKFDEKQGVLGLNDGKTFRSWVLLADYYDETMLRNRTAFKLGDVLLDGRYFSADCAHVEVYINGHYQGVYLLCEKTQIKKNRVNITEKEDADITTLQTGYLMIGQGGIPWEDNYFDIPIGFHVTDRNGTSQYYGAIRFVLSGGDDYSQAQRSYVSAYCSGAFRVMYAAIYEETYYTLSRDGQLTIDEKLTGNQSMTTAEKQIACINAVFDLDAAARMCVLDEIAKNLDAMTFNLYVDLSPEGSGRLTLAAPWDFDHAMAKTHYSTTHTTSGWYATTLAASDGVRVNFMTVMLGSTQWFNDMCSEVWRSHYTQIQATLQSVLVENYRYEEAFERDWATWGHPLNRAQTGHHTPSDLQQFQSHTDSAEFLYAWLTRRVQWLNRQWGDDTTVEEVVPSPLLDIDFTKQENASYLSDFRRCSGEITSTGLYLTQSEGRDPHFYINFTGLPEDFEAEDYPYLEITCKIPLSNQMDHYVMELFLCAGAVYDATGGIMTQFDLDGTPRGGYCTYRINLAETGFWEGTIHKIRIDFFATCAPGDSMYISHVALKTK